MSGQLYERRAQLETRSPLTLLTTIEIDDIPTADLSMNYDDGTKKKVKVPTHDLESVELVLYCFHEFMEAARKLFIDNAEWFEYYRDTLRGHARTAWDLLANEVDMNRRNEVTFRNTFRSYIATIVDETAHRSLMEYLRSTVKPRTMSVMELSRRVQVLCMYAIYLPTETGNPPEAISDDERKTLFFNMMPEDWKTSFTRSNLRISGMNITQMTIYFNGLCALETSKDRTGKRRRNDNANSNTNNYKHRRTGGYNDSSRRNNGRNGSGANRYNDRNGRENSRGGRGRGNGRGGRGRGNSSGRGRVQGTDTCPVHGGHLWRECFLNPHGDDYRPRTGNNQGNNNNSQGRGNGSRRGDAYHSNNRENGGNSSQGNGSNQSANGSSSNNNDGERRNNGGGGSNAGNNRNEHYLAEIGEPNWEQE